MRKQRKTRLQKNLVLLLTVTLAMAALSSCGKTAETVPTVIEPVAVNVLQPEQGDIVLEREFIATISSENSVSVIPLVTGEVLTVEVQAGDVVEKGQVLFTVDSDSMDSTINTIDKTITRVERAYALAKENYDDILEEQEKLTVKAKTSGYVKSIDVEIGDEVTGAAQIAYIYDNKYMELRVPFLTNEVGTDWVGKEARLEMVSTGEEVFGTVKEVEGTDEFYTSGQMVRYVTITVENPGALQAGMQAIAVIDGKESLAAGNFDIGDDAVILPDYPGIIEEILVKEGDWVEKDQPLMQMSSETLKNQIKSYKSALDSASDSVTDAYDNQADTEDALDNYTVTATVGGVVDSIQVTEHNMISSGTVAAVISDKSSMSASFGVSEEVRRTLSLGQSVVVERSGAEYAGTITEIGTTVNNTGLFNVKISVNAAGSELLSGTVVKVRMATQKSENTLLLPYDSVYYTNGKGHVFIEENGMAVKKDITTGLYNEDTIEITDGLTGNEKVITTWSPRLADGVEVNAAGEEGAE